MNEQIKILADQAGIKTNANTEYFKDNLNKWMDYYSEELAKLIIMECANIVDNHGRWILYDKLAIKIKQHFGITE